MLEPSLPTACCDLPLSRAEAGWMAMGLGLTACRSVGDTPTAPLGLPSGADGISRGERSLLAAAGALSLASVILLLGA